MTEISDQDLDSLLQAYREGVLVGDLAGCRVWLQLLGAFVLDHEETGERRLVLGEVQVAGSFAPRHALIVPWQEIVAVERDENGEARIRLRQGTLRLLTAARVRELLAAQEGGGQGEG